MVSDLRQDVTDDLPVDVGQAEITAGIEVGQLLLIEAKLLQIIQDVGLICQSGITTSSNCRCRTHSASRALVVASKSQSRFTPAVAGAVSWLRAAHFVVPNSLARAMAALDGGFRHRIDRLYKDVSYGLLPRLRAPFRSRDLRHHSTAIPILPLQTNAATRPTVEQHAGISQRQATNGDRDFFNAAHVVTSVELIWEIPLHR